MKTITLIGSGPRGISVLERMIVRLNKTPLPYDIHIIVVDQCRLGQGRIWNSDQSKCFITNTPAAGMTAFSGVGPFEDPKPGAGPSLETWWKATHNDIDTYMGYAPRKYYGEYLRFVYDTILEHVPARVKITEMIDQVIDIIPEQDHYNIKTKSKNTWSSDKVIITTGHSINHYQDHFGKLEEAARHNDLLTFFHSDSVADMHLDRIPPKENIGIIGLGLSFIDVISELTEGRGGYYTKTTNGKLRYIRSGKEPHMYCGSRKGLPILSQGYNQKPDSFKYNPVIFTHERAKKLRQQKPNSIDFETDVWPLLEAEVNCVWFGRNIACQLDEQAAQDFIAQVSNNHITTTENLTDLASKILNTSCSALHLKELATPFSKQTFSNYNEWRSRLVALLEEDTEQALSGNVDSPLKAALDVLRFMRTNLRTVVNHGGLTPDSHHQFISQYNNIITLFSAGPPCFRLQQLLALIDDGIVSIVPPQINITVEKTNFKISSHVLPHYTQSVTTLIDARVPTPDLKNDRSPLAANLLKRGIFSVFTNSNNEGDAFETGSIHITTAPFNPVKSDGSVQKALFVLGIPVEHLRWLMSVGSSAPSEWTDFMVDADAIAEAVLAA